MLYLFCTKIFSRCYLQLTVPGSSKEDSYGIAYISVEDCFPVIRQTILDTYKVDSFLMHYPYSDLERLDMGLRKMVWGTYSTNSAIFSLSPEQDAWQIIVLKSVLGFYNLIITVTNEEHPDMFGFMPFRTEPATPLSSTAS